MSASQRIGTWRAGNGVSTAQAMGYVEGADGTLYALTDAGRFHNLRAVDSSALARAADDALRVELETSSAIAQLCRR